MRIILLGPPGSGKGTQAALIQKKYNIPHISTGDIFRKNIKNNTPIGIEAKKYIDKGLLVPDEITLQIIEDRFSEDDCKNGFLLDGFPRTLVQAEALGKELVKLDKKLDAVVNLVVRDEVIVNRMTGRRVCDSCGSNYNIHFSKPKVDGVCDKCGGHLYSREDDSFETVTRRLEVYNNQTQPLIKYYTEKALLKAVDGELSAEEVFDYITKALESIQ